MPVACKLIEGKYRITENGKIAVTDKNIPRDGGGHDSMDACEKQATAINLNLSSNISVLSYDSETFFAVSGVEENKQRFKKDMIQEGLYIHPVHKWKLNVTPERMQRWLTNFKAMRENGVDVEVPLDHSLSSAKNIGYVVDAMLETNKEGKLTMFGVLEIRGKESIEIIERNRNVSVWVDQNFSDGSGNHYGEVIKHCSVVQQPVVQQQQDFIPIAASQSGVNENVPIFHIFSRSEHMNEEQLKKLRALHGFGDEATEDNILSMIETHNKKQAGVLKTSQDEVLALRTQVNSHKAASTIDANTLELVSSTINEKLELLVEKGKITPDVMKKLSAILVGPSGSRNQFALSISEDQNSSIASGVVDALKENDIVKLGEKTSYQVLSREDADDETDEVKPDEEGGKAMSAGAGVTEASK